MKLKQWIIVLVILISSIIACRDLFKPGYFSIHDDLQVGRLYEMDLCFKDGQFPCRWVPDMGYGYGYPLFNFYPPLPYYFGEVFHIIGFSFLDSTKIMFIASIFISAVLMYLFGKSLWGEWGGLLSSVLYVFAPYHSIDVYVRGAMNEAWAMAFLPGVCWAVYEIIDRPAFAKATAGKDRVRDVSIFAVLYACLLLSHNLMAFIFTPVIAVFALMTIWLKKKNFKDKIIKLLIGGLWGFGLAAFFTLPVIVEKKYAHVDTMLMGYFNYLAHYVSIGKMLFTRYWGYGSSGWLQETGMPFQVGIFHWELAVFVFLFGAFMYFRKKIKKEIFFNLTFFLLVFLSFLFLVHPRSVFIWNAIPVLAYLQFPWRFLTLVAFAISILGGGVVIFFKKQKSQIIVSMVLIFTAIILNYSFFRVEKTFPMTDSEKLFSAKGWNKLQTDAIFDYLPIYAKAPPAGPAPNKPVVKEGMAAITDVEKGSNWYQFKAEVINSAVVEIPMYDFPGMKVTINGKKAPIGHDNFLGLITINAGKGINNVMTKFTNTPIRMIANLLSLTCLFLLLFLNFKKKNVKH